MVTVLVTKHVMSIYQCKGYSGDSLLAVHKKTLSTARGDFQLQRLVRVDTSFTITIKVKNTIEGFVSKTMNTKILNDVFVFLCAP